MTEETKERFNAKAAIESMDAQLDAIELVLDANIKAIEEMQQTNAELIGMLNKMSTALGLPKSIIPKLKEAS